jgi:O-antigen/teichoic acid export membrane protein
VCSSDLFIELTIRFLALAGIAVIAFSVDKSYRITAIVWLSVFYALFLALANGIASGRSLPVRLGFYWKEFVDMIDYGWKYNYGQLMSLLIVKSDVLFLNAMRTASETGIYRQIEYTSELVLLIPMVVQTILFPKLMQEGSSEETGYDDRAGFVMLVSRLTTSIQFTIWLALVVTGRWFLGIYGPEFPAGYFPMIILITGTLFMGIYSVLYVELRRRGLPIFVVTFWTCAIALKLVGNYFLVPRYGMYGAASSSLLTHLMFLVLVLWYCSRNYGFSLLRTLFIQPGDYRLLSDRFKKMMAKGKDKAD